MQPGDQIYLADSYGVTVPRSSRSLGNSRNLKIGKVNQLMTRREMSFAATSGVRALQDREVRQSKLGAAFERRTQSVEERF